MIKRNSFVSVNSYEADYDLVHFSNTQKKHDLDTDFPFQQSLPDHPIYHEELKRLRQTIAKQDRLISLLLSGSTDHEDIPKLELTKFVEETGGSKKRAKKEWLLLKEFIQLERQQKSCELKKMGCEMERMWLDFKAREIRDFSESEFDRYKKENDSIRVEINQLKATKQQVTTILQIFQKQNSELVTLVKNQSIAIDLLKKAIDDRPQPPLCQLQGFVEDLAGCLDQLQNQAKTVSRHRRDFSRTMMLNQRSLECNCSNSELWNQSRESEGEDRLRARLHTAKKRIRYLQRQNKEVNQILDGLIPMLKKKQG